MKAYFVFASELIWKEIIMEKTKRRAAALLVCLVISGSIIVPADASSIDYYQNDTFGFSISNAGSLSEDIEIRENSNGISFYYLPAEQGDWGGLLGSIVVVSPKSAYFSSDYFDTERTIIAMSDNSIYYYIPSVGGADSGEHTMEGYIKALSAISPEWLRENIAVTGSVSFPYINTERLSGVISTLENEGIKMLTRDYTAIMLYSLLSDTTASEASSPFNDIVSDSSEYDAILCLSDLGIVNGYEDGSFRPDATITRAEFCVMLSRLLFVPYPWWYGDGIAASDVGENHWAWNYLNYAVQHGWIAEAEGKIRPDEPITAREAAEALRLAYERLL